MSSGTAREHVRVARALLGIPVIRAEFAAARLSYAKVRALTRIATPATEAGLAELAGPMTGNQLERFARAHRQCSRADDAAARVRRRLTWRFEDDGSLAGSFRLPPLAGAVLLKALRAAAGDPAQPGEGEAEGGGTPGVPAETAAAPGERVVATSSDLADALLVVAESFLAGKVAGADDAEVYQVVLHVGTDAIPAAGVSAETPPDAPPGPRPGDPADPARCHVEDGAAISITTAQMIGCTAALSWMARGALAARYWTWAAAGAVPARPSARPPANATRAAAGTPAASPAGSTSTTSGTGPTAAPPAWTTSSACASVTTRPSTTAATSSPPAPAAPSPSTPPAAPRSRRARTCHDRTAPSGTSTTRRSPRRRSSRPGTANGSTSTTPSTPA